MQSISPIVNILLVDDREDGLIALEAILSENKNYNLVMAHSGFEAYALVRQMEFAMILLDVQMPEIDGFQTAEMIRTHEEYASIPILFVTAINKDDRYVYKGYEAGAVDYIFKPFDPLILKSKVAVFADLHLKARQIQWQAKELSRQEALEHKAYTQSIELESLIRYRNLADAIPHMVWRAASDGNLEYYNKIWCSYTGLTLDESVGSAWQQAFHPEDLKNLLCSWMLSIQSGKNFELECRIRRHDGVYHWHWIQAVAERNTEGQVIAWLGTCTDIHERKQVERKLVRAQKNAEAANRTKTQFLANMSHEIRTPLNAILGFTELMLDPKITNQERMNALTTVRRNSQSLLKIIDEILDISKIEAGGLEIEKIETDLVGLILEIRSFLNVNALKKKIQLSFRVKGEVPDKILTDSNRLRQILLNMVGNAIKFTNRGSVVVTVQFAKKEDGKSYLYFSVADTGIGVSDTTTEKIFSPFLQADSSTTRLYGGTGLGLALSRKLARALDGDVWLQKSELGVGSTFVVEIEAVVLPNAKMVQHFSAIDFSEPTKNYVENEQVLAGKKILLVEDAIDNQVLISHYLKNSGAVIDIAQNGQEAIDKALSADYSVVLMDIQMPVLDGYEATSRLRQAGYKRPIIALTAHALNEEREKSLRTGCSEHLTKPIEKKQLISSLVYFAQQ